MRKTVNTGVARKSETLAEKRRVKMKKKIIIFLSVFSICLCLTGCSVNEHDTVQINNRTSLISDNIIINIMDGYFYDTYEKFKVDDDNIAVTIYFSREGIRGSGSWDEPQTDCER